MQTRRNLSSILGFLLGISLASSALESVVTILLFYTADWSREALLRVGLLLGLPVMVGLALIIRVTHGLVYRILVGERYVAKK